LNEISTSTILEVLNRLNHYYYGRMRAARKLCAESLNAQSGYEYALAATRWEAMQVAIHTVATNLELTLKEIE